MHSFHVKHRAPEDNTLLLQLPSTTEMPMTMTSLVIADLVNGHDSHLSLLTLSFRLAYGQRRWGAVSPFR